MIIRLGKFEAVVICSVLVAVSFLFALKSERETASVYESLEYTEVPVLMYHHVTTKKEKCGKYTIHRDDLEADLQYIKERGYNTVSISQLIDYAENGAPLPEKPIVITFDDGFESFYSLAYPLFKEHGMKAVVSVIGKVTEKYSEHEDHNIAYSNLNFTQLSEMLQSGLVEIQNHSYDMHNNKPGQRKGISKLSEESEDDYKSALTEDLLTLQKILKLKCRITPQCVAYPFGAYSKETLSIIKKLGFKSTMLCEERVNKIIKGDPDSLYNLGRYNRDGTISTKEYFSNIPGF